MKTLISTASFMALLFVSAITSEGAIVTVSFDSGSYTLYNSNGTTPLTGGTSTDGNGAVIQLGYFSSATSATPFAGTWVPLTGQGGANSAFATTSIGDTNANQAGNGTFAMNLTFDPAIPGRNASLPAVGVPLGIRVFNNTTLASSTRYITISSTLSTWQWLSPSDPPNNPVIVLTLDDTPSTLRIENGTLAGAAVGSSPPANAFSTATPVPEPSVIALQGLVALSALCFRSRNLRRV